MASFFGPYTLRLEQSERQRLASMDANVKRMAEVMEAFLAKANEPPPPDPDVIPIAEVQGMVDAWAAALRVTRLHSEEEIRRLTEEAMAHVPPAAAAQP